MDRLEERTLQLEKFECPQGKIFEDFPRGKLGKFEGVGSTLGTKKVNSHCQNSCKSDRK